MAQSAEIEAPACPGGPHPNAPGQVCCDACWKRAPTNLPDWPRWRSALRGARSRGGYGWVIAERIHDALRAWLAEHPRVTPPGVGNDGMTDDERADSLDQFSRGVGSRVYPPGEGQS